MGWVLFGGRVRQREWPPPEPSGPPWSGRSCLPSLRLRVRGRTTMPETVAPAADIRRISTSPTCSRVQWPRTRRLRVPPRPRRLDLGRIRICTDAGSVRIFPLNGSAVDTGGRVVAAVLATSPDPDVRALRDEARKCRRFGCDPPLLWWQSDSTAYWQSARHRGLTRTSESTVVQSSSSPLGRQRSEKDKVVGEVAEAALSRCFDGHCVRRHTWTS